MNQEQFQINDKTIPKSALKKEIKKGNQRIQDQTNLSNKRFDRRGYEIKQGSKYQITINENAQLLSLNSEQDQMANLDSLNSPKQENIESFTKTSFKISRNLELNSKEEAFLKMLSNNFEKNKRKGKRKECCIIW